MPPNPYEPPKEVNERRKPTGMLSLVVLLIVAILGPPVLFRLAYYVRVEKAEENHSPVQTSLSK